MRFLSKMFDAYIVIALIVGLCYGVFSAYKYNVILGAVSTLVMVFVAIVLGFRGGNNEY